MFQLLTLAKHESPELQEADLVHLQPGVSFHAPAQVRAAPGSKVVAAGGIPEKAQDATHETSVLDQSARILPSAIAASYKQNHGL